MPQLLALMKSDGSERRAEGKGERERDTNTHTDRETRGATAESKVDANNNYIEVTAGSVGGVCAHRPWARG